MNTSSSRGVAPYASIDFRKSDNCLYRVCKKEGLWIRNFLGQFPKKPFMEIEEFLLLDFYVHKGDEKVFSICTTNPNVIMATPTGIFYEGQEKRLITSFSFTSEWRAYGTYGNDALLLNATPDLTNLTLRFYKDIGDFASELLAMWEYGCIEDKVAWSVTAR